ncbi:MAG TPA: response regulator, partial [Polyangiaceae bacterium]
MKEAARQPCVLLVEDNPADVFLIRLLLGRVACAVELHVATDGEKALDLLDVRLDPPYLILLDLNLPKLDGWELLRRIKSRPERYFAPVVVLSSA